MANAEAIYEGRAGIETLLIDPPANRITPEGVASYLRFGGRISDRVLRGFTWAGERYTAMGQLEAEQ